jgi:hypothetical protein
MTVFTFQSAFLQRPDTDGKPLGTSAALMLSLLVALSTQEADERGWFALSPQRGEEIIGFSHDTQKRIRERLMAAGYIRYRFKGQGGQIQYFVCTQDAYKVSTQNAYKQGNEIGAEGVSTQNAYKAEGFPPSSPPSLPFPDPISLNPPIIPPPQGNRERRTTKPAFIPPTLEEIQAFVVKERGGSMADAENFFDHFSANGWRVSGKTPMRDWKAAARKWVRTSAQWEAPSQARAGPPGNGRDRNRGVQEAAEEIDRWFSTPGAT